MAFLQFKNVRIAGFAAGVPKHIGSNLSNSDNNISDEYTPEDFVEATGVLERHISDNLTTSDLGYEAAKKLISDLGWEKSEIEALIFVSQTSDYVFPATACILQNRLGLSKECYTADVALGCSGWVYGLSYISGLLNAGTIKKALLIAGDAKPRVHCIVNPLFGHAATATAIEYKEGTDNIMFHFGTDGSGYDAIITPDGGSRNQTTPDSFKTEMVDGREINRLQGRMKGMDVFAFGISTAPKSIKKLAEHFGIGYLDADYFVFHQANMMMNNTIVKKLKLDPEKVPSSMYNFGNTSSASIPLTIVTQLKGKIENRPTKFICCGFGVGLSWGSVAMETNNIVISDLIEVEEPQGESSWV
jgi:3-oxoacyl-[acyl-carrier-protein] synthase-3